MNNYTIFISSADSYSDLWPVFFDLFKLHWPDYNGVIYLNTQEKSFSHPGLNIKCTKVGKHKYFGLTFRKGLDLVPNNNILLIMIDYIFTGKVNSNKINTYFDFFIDNKLDSLCLANQNFPNIEPTIHVDLIKVNAPAPHVMFSYQIAFWKKSILYQMALPHENPWSSEWFGTKRAEKMNINLVSIADEIYNPIPYNLAGCLHKGKWLEDAVVYLKSINYYIDFNARGFYTEPKPSLKNKFTIKKMLIKDGLKGSYFDLWRRKSLH